MPSAVVYSFICVSIREAFQSGSASIYGVKSNNRPSRINLSENTFKKRFEISVDINGYKEDRYKKVASMAKRFGKQVLRTKAEIKLDPMPADERKVMHQELSRFEHIKTESHGEGKNRHMVISYVD